jgi:hypothetical protein
MQRSGNVFHDHKLIFKYYSDKILVSVPFRRGLKWRFSVFKQMPIISSQFKAAPSRFSRGPHDLNESK